ncbi:DUF1016 N-terminal domain-containing protein [Pseudomonas capsici]|uniref:hypothetical protein n=1 Tax=Pseudomonas capsici TaxID=2810614 RepID=UPI00384EA8D8
MSNSTTSVQPEGYSDWLMSLKGDIKRARQRAALAVNSELVRLYHRFGQQPADQLPWFHIVTLLTKPSNTTDQEWYAAQAVVSAKVINHFVGGSLLATSAYRRRISVVFRPFSPASCN